MQSIDSVKKFLKSMIIAKKKKIKNPFNNNLVIFPEDKQRFQSCNKCWMCDKLFDVGNNNSDIIFI